MSTNNKAKPRKSKEKMDYRKLADILSELDEITNEFMNEGLKPIIHKCSPHTSKQVAVGGISNDRVLDLYSEMARMEKDRI